MTNQHNNNSNASLANEQPEKRYSFLGYDPYPEPLALPDRACERKDSVGTMTTITIHEPEKPTAGSTSTPHDMHLKASQATLTSDQSTSEKTPPLGRLRFLLILCSLLLASFLAMLDQSILGAALPAITNQFGDLSAITWVTAAYMLSFTSLQPITSKVSEIVGRLPVLVVSLVVFCAGSAVCGAAPSMTVLIAGRAIAGCGGCGISTMVQVILIDLLPLRERSTYMSFMSMASTLAVIAGPLIGGAIADHWVWRWCFYLNIPICAVICAISVISVRGRTPPGTAREKVARIDFLGALILLAGLVLFILALNWAGHAYSWKSAAVLVPLCLSVVLLAAFTYVEAKVVKEPIITMRMFTSRTLTPILVSQIFLGAGITFTVLYLPVYFTTVYHVSSTTAGIYMLPYLIGMMATGLVIGPLVTRFNIYRPFIWVGLAAMTVSAGLLNIITPDTKLAVVLVLIGIFGVASGVGMMPMLIATQAAAEPQDAGTASTLAFLLRNIGSIVGIATVGSIFNNSLVKSMVSIAAVYPNYRTRILNAVNDSSVAWSSSLPAQVHQMIIDGYVKALKATFIANAPFVGLCFLLTLFIKHRSLGQRPAKK
ncbi:hypothetical protein LPJ73_000439 [Coemansia sp. RSA 2703]|nr:hypothetical protein LPJ73_000439 [Coemansia sp. RSA 2703]KAJ2373038.1 hypothetical protein IW150_003816 [Coemansia sp. RSA 2607]KAJ2395769.1 hypothetical protein GGI05_001428 [Coemansia sp. RSA 2603]